MSPWCTPFKWHPNRSILRIRVGILIMTHVTSSPCSILSLILFLPPLKTQRLFSQRSKKINVFSWVHLNVLGPRWCHGKHTNLHTQQHPNDPSDVTPTWQGFGISVKSLQCLSVLMLNIQPAGLRCWRFEYHDGSTGRLYIHLHHWLILVDIIFYGKFVEK